VRDDRLKWSAAEFAAPETLVKHSLEADGIHIQVQGKKYSVCLRRDRVLLINHGELHDGWQTETGLAVSQVNDAYVVFELTGPKVMLLIQRGAEMFLHEPSKSATRFIFGYEVILYRIDDWVFRLHVDRAHADALWAHFAATVPVLTDVGTSS